MFNTAIPPEQDASLSHVTPPPPLQNKKMFGLPQKFIAPFTFQDGEALTAQGVLDDVRKAKI